MLSLLDTPSDGQDEVLYALRLERGRATSEGGVDCNRIMRHLPPHIPTADVDTVLATLAGLELVASSGSGWTLTAAGITDQRANYPRRSRIDVQ